jgi:hypothetical protein
MYMHWKSLYPLRSWSGYGPGTILFYKDGEIGCSLTNEANLIFYAVQHNQKMTFLPFDTAFKICKGFYVYSRIIC